MSTLSHSALSLYRDCQLRYRYERQLGLTPRAGHASHDLRYGSAGHIALAALYSGDTLKHVGEAFMSAYPVDEYPSPLPRYASGKSQSNFLSALWKYINDAWSVDREQWEVLEVEVPRTTEGMGEYDHVLVLDLVVRDKQDGLVWGVDHKITGGYLDAKFWARHELSSQVRMYTDDIKRRYGSCGGFIINAISLRNRSRAYTPRTGPDAGVQLPAGDWFAFGRMTYRPNNDCLALERENLRITADDIARSIATDRWSYNTARCHGGTAWACPYYQICQPGWSWPRDRETIEEYFRQRCGKRISGVNGGVDHCERDREHDGDCSNEPPEAATIMVDAGDSDLFSEVED